MTAALVTSTPSLRMYHTRPDDTPALPINPLSQGFVWRVRADLVRGLMAADLRLAYRLRHAGVVILRHGGDVPPQSRAKEIIMPKTNTLIDLKLSVVNFHADLNEQARIGIARDACYTSNNSLEYKQGQVDFVVAELKVLRDQFNGSEVVDVRMGKKAEYLSALMFELSCAEERHEADKAVYKEVSGDTWKASPKTGRTTAPVKTFSMADIDALIGQPSA